MKNITSTIGYIVLAVVLLQVVYSFTLLSAEPFWNFNVVGLRVISASIFGACGFFYLFVRYLGGKS